MFYGSADVILFHSDIFNAEINYPAVFKGPNLKLEKKFEEDDVYSLESEYDDFDAKTINQVCKQTISLSLWKHRRILYNNIENSNGLSMVPVSALNENNVLWQCIMYSLTICLS